MKIELRRAALTYQAPDGEVAALRDVTFGVADGEFVSIVGPPGCGKSTLLALIAGIIILMIGMGIGGVFIAAGILALCNGYRLQNRGFVE